MCIKNLNKLALLFLCFQPILWTLSVCQIFVLYNSIIYKKTAVKIKLNNSELMLDRMNGYASLKVNETESIDNIYLIARADNENIIVFCIPEKFDIDVCGYNLDYIGYYVVNTISNQARKICYEEIKIVLKSIGVSNIVFKTVPEYLHNR